MGNIYGEIWRTMGLSEAGHVLPCTNRTVDRFVYVGMKYVSFYFVHDTNSAHIVPSKKLFRERVIISFQDQ